MQVPYEFDRPESGPSGTYHNTSMDTHRYNSENLAREEPSSIVTALADGYTSQMSTDTGHDQP